MLHLPFDPDEGATAYYRNSQHPELDQINTPGALKVIGRVLNEGAVRVMHKYPQVREAFKPAGR